MSIDTSEIRFCRECYGRMYVAFTSPAKWVHVSTDTTKCDSAQNHSPVEWPDIPRRQR